MAPTDNNWSRRDFLKAAGAAGAGSVIAPIESLADSADEPRAMPTRPFGKTGVRVPILVSCPTWPQRITGPNFPVKILGCCVIMPEKPVQIIAQVVLTFASRPSEAMFPLAM